MYFLIFVQTKNMQIFWWNQTHPIFTQDWCCSFPYCLMSQFWQVRFSIHRYLPNSLIWGCYFHCIFEKSMGEFSGLVYTVKSGKRRHIGRVIWHSTLSWCLCIWLLDAPAKFFFFTKTAITRERKVEKSFPRWEMTRLSEGY